MDLPESVAALGKRLDKTGAIAADPQLLNGADVFASERERLFTRPWIAVNHRNRLAADGRYFHFDTALSAGRAGWPRTHADSILVTRAADGRLHALRNVCMHAGYHVCEAEEGSAERLVCHYHRWEYALDGWLVKPDLSRWIDPSRRRLASYPVCVRDGLIFVDPSGAAGPPAETDQAIKAGPMPSWLADGDVIQRTRYSTHWNWKLVLQLLKSSPHLVFDEPGDDGCIVFGPLSLMRVHPRQAALLRVIPQAAERTDIQLIRMAPRGAPCPPAAPNGADRMAEGLRQAGDSDAVARSVELDRAFFAWYWSLISAN